MMLKKRRQSDAALEWDGKDPAPPSPWVRRAIEAGILILGLLIALTVRLGVFESAVVISRSMQPTYFINDRIMLDHRAVLHGHWRRGDIILFNVPDTWKDSEEDEDTLLKRIIGLPGETVAISDEGVFIDGKKLNEPYLANGPLQPNNMELTLDDKEYFVMGDNRNNSEDSRVNGPINDNDIVGRVTLQLTPLAQFGRVHPPAYAELKG